jgi:hypothetical protein
MKIRSSLALRALAIAAAMALGVPLVHGSPILPGDLVNIRIGDGSTATSGAALPVTLDDYAVTYSSMGIPTVTLRQSIAVLDGAAGTAPTSGQRYLAQGGTAAGEGALTLSTDGRFMALVGYNSGKGDLTNGGVSANKSLEDRVVGLLNLSTGAVDTSTALTDLTGGGNGTNAIRGVFTSNGTTIWTANSALGIRATTFDASTSTALTGTSNERRVYAFNNQLYLSRQSGTVDGVATVGTGTPATGAQTVTLLPGFPTSAVEQAYDFLFTDSSTLYVVDDGSSTSSNPGLQKWKLNNGSWQMAFNHPIAAMNPGTSTAAKGLRSLTGFVDAHGNTVLFAGSAGTTTNTQGVSGVNLLIGLVDPAGNTTGTGVIENTMVDASSFGITGSGSWNLRGVSLAPTPAIGAGPSVSLTGSGAPAATLNLVGSNGMYASDIATLGASPASATVEITGIGNAANDGAIPVLVDLEGSAGDISSLIATLQGGAGDTAQAVTPDNINTLAPWAAAAGYGMDFQLLLTFNDPNAAGPFFVNLNNFGSVTIDRVAAIPEPTTLAIVALAAPALLGRRRRAH